MTEPDESTIAELNLLADDIRARLDAAGGQTLETGLLILDRRMADCSTCRTIARPSITIMASGA